MVAEILIYEVLKHLADGRVYPDFALEGTARPFIVYQAVGGAPVNFLTGERPDRQRVRMQVSVWADVTETTRVAVSELGQQVEDAIRAATSLQPEVATGRVATYDAEANARGTRQDFYLFC